MKKASIFLAAAVMAVTGCSKADLIPDTTSSQTTPSEDTGTYDNEEDDVANTEFVRTISIVWSSNTATVTGDANRIVSVSGADVVVDNTGTTEKVKYELSGSSSDGSLKIYSNNKQELVLNSLSLKNPSGAAINNQGKKRCFVVVNGTNSLTDGATYTYSGEEDEKAAFFSEGQLIFSGSGVLTVNAVGKSGITSDDYIRFTGPTVNVSSSAGHGIRGKDAVAIDAGNIDVTVSAAMKKGITSDSLVVFNGGITSVKVSGDAAYDSEDKEYKASAGVKADQIFKMNDGLLTVTNSGRGGKGLAGDGAAYFNGGTVNVDVSGDNDSKADKSAKGIKFDKDIYFAGGTVNALAESHEAIESKGILKVTGGAVYGFSNYDDGINSAGDMTISGGYVCAWTDGTKTGADGFDANGNIYITGGVSYGVCIHGGADVGFDANSEKQKQLVITGGTIIAVGGFERGYSMTGSAYSASAVADKWYGLWDSSSNAVIAFKAPSTSTTLAVYSSGSQPTLKSEVTTGNGTVIFDGNGFIPGTISGGSDVTLSEYSDQGGNPGGGGPGGGWPGGGGPGGRP